jgi:cell division protein DivIC
MLSKLTRLLNRTSLWFTMPVLVLVLLIIFFSSLVIRTYNELKNFQMRESRLELRLLEAESEFKRKEAYFKRLLEDDEFLERVARQRLGYARPDELLFRFND